ncbi:hypothetical protein NLX83_39465 [Allokutzneria sp. A3M-2-11 16]|uniref:hypothetical protein n=1 Tax=Allokutzneria sp. A3M-2-11 16 TaxID=2962043 RepID=UPI0020B6D67B|nr:hypothetical protein [Allokutzneria sp. A3M-2-11 16]MCP3805363.1 hypothetical protein [Allokutzneria sp. A3M-2-11 16]
MSLGQSRVQLNEAARKLSQLSGELFVATETAEYLYGEMRDVTDGLEDSELMRAVELAGRIFDCVKGTSNDAAAAVELIDSYTARM